MKTKMLLPIVLIAMVTFLGESAESKKSSPAATTSEDNGEFKKYPTDLMYSDNTMRQLEHIVDSLNIRFRTCEPSKTYYSKYQARAHYFKLEKGDIDEAKEDLENKISFEDFLKKYPDTKLDSYLVVVKYHYKTYQNKDIIELSSILPEHEINIDGGLDVYQKAFKDSWIFDYWEGSSYSKESVRGFYFTTEFVQKPIKDEYARMIQYSDCMVDTTTEIFKEDAKAERYYDEDESGKIADFLKYVHKGTERPVIDGKEESWKNYRKWDSLRFSLIETKLAQEPKFKLMLKAALEEALLKGSNDEFDEYVGRFYSKKVELELRRNRRVIGRCSMDDSPRVHAMKIAVLSAETIHWETFLRAHLDIMNDRFERVSDGSYAWAARQTYIQELEELDINVADLLLGISLRLENPSQNHYYGSISRLGRALSETRFAREIETKILGLIKDNDLDDHNRILMYYLFLNYNHHIKDESRKKENIESLKAAVRELPEYLATKIKIKE
jgi:hypothetical protein